MGLFFIKSTYALEVERGRKDLGESSTPKSKEMFWKNIWKLNIPSSIKHFIWRACHDILPTTVPKKKRYQIDRVPYLYPCSENSYSLFVGMPPGL